MRYYSILRPITPGTYPQSKDNEVLHFENFETRTYIGRIGREAWGYIEYAKPLTDEEMSNYELVLPSDSEDKHKICSLLCKVLQKTRGASDLISLDFDTKTEIVTANFESGGNRRINVACDSGVAMIRDIMNHLEI